MSDTNALSQAEWESREAYYLVLGQFMQMFASAEAAMQVMLWKASGLSDIKTAAALLSGVKIDSAISLIRRVREAKNLEPHRELEHICQQIGIINSARNDIVHFGATFMDGIGPTITNLRIAHIEERIRGFVAKPPILADMIDDLIKINRRLLEIVRNYDAPEEQGELDTWLYKHKLLIGSPQKSPGKTPKRKGRQKSSPE